MGTTSAVKLSQLAYSRFKESLFARRIRPGAVMSQAALAEIVGVPVGPLREAVQVLESEGLLTVMPRSGIRIVKPDMELVRDSFQLRRILEREAAARFAEQAPAEVLEQHVRAHTDMIERADSTQDAANLWDLAIKVDGALHTTLIEGLRNKLIEGVFDRVYCQIRLVRLDMQYVLTPVLIKRTMQEHLRVIDALRRHDAQAAAEAMDEHLTQAMHRAMWL